MDPSDPYSQSLDAANKSIESWRRNPSTSDLQIGLRQARSALEHTEKPSTRWLEAKSIETTLLWIAHVRNHSDTSFAEAMAALVEVMTNLNREWVPGPFFMFAGAQLNMLAYNKTKDNQLLEGALMFMPPGFPGRLDCLITLSDALWQDYKANNEVELAKQVLKHRKGALLEPEIPQATRLNILGAIGGSMTTVFTRTLEPEDLEIAIAYTKQFIAADEGKDPKGPCALGICLTHRYELLQEEGDIKEAILMLDKAIDSTPVDDPDLPHRYNYKLRALDRWHNVFEDKKLLAELWKLANDNIHRTRSDSEERVLAVLNLGNLCHRMYEEDGNPQHLLSALKHLNDVEIIVTESHEYYVDYCEIRSIVLLSQYQHEATPLCLDESERFVNEAIRLEKRGPTALSEHIFQRGNILLERAVLSGLAVDFQTAIKVYNDCIKKAPARSPSRKNAIFKLCSAHLALYRIDAAKPTIMQALDYGYDRLRAVTSAPRRRSEILNLLSNAYFARFEIERSRESLDKAIQLGVEALSDDQDAHQVEYLTNLASKYRSRAIRYEQKNDIDEALNLSRQAFQIEGPPKRTKIVAVGTLSMILLDWCRLHNADKHLNEAIEKGQQCLSLRGITRTDDADMTFHLGECEYEKYLRSKDPQHLKAAISFGQKTLTSCPDWSYKLAMFLGRVGEWLVASLGESDDESHTSEVVRILQRGLNITTAAAIYRIRCGQCLSSLYLQHKNWNKAFETLKQVIDLFPMVSPRALSREDQQFALSQLSGLPGVAASCALLAGVDPAIALETLESGRGIMSTWDVTLRSDLSDLRLAKPAVATKYDDLRQQLVRTRRSIAYTNILHEDQTFKTHSTAPNEAARRLEQEISDLENDIRSDERFALFQKPLSSTDIRQLGDDRPIVIINVTSLRSDAFLLLGGKVRKLLLENFTQKIVTEKLLGLFGPDRLSLGLSSTYHQRNIALRDLLGWLWDACVRPVLEELNLIQRQPGKTAQVFWVTNGLTTFCPFHAAGRYGKGRSDNAVSHVISSYVTTLRMLRFNREHKVAEENSKPSRALIVTMDETIGNSHLSASKEASKILNTLRAITQIEPQVLKQPSRQQVLETLSNHQIVHLACHGSADATNPSQSRLLLHNSLNAAVPDSLTVADIADLQGTGTARLVYLSACSTAEIKDLSLIDENIHIAGIFQTIGYPNVIGTLWSVGDSAAVMTAEAFYNKLFIHLGANSEGKLVENPMSNEIIARAFHEAVKELREKKVSRGDPVEDVLSWVPFVHFGA